MVAHPQLRFQMGESRTRKRIVGGEEEEVEERRGEEGDRCGLVMSNFFGPIATRLGNDLQSLLESGANRRVGSVGSPAS